MSALLGAHACPRCSAAVRPGAPWCTQCYADLRTGPAPAAPLAPAPEPAAVRDDPRWPCAACGTGNALGTDACAACGEGFLAAVRAEQATSLVLPVVGDLVHLSRAQRVGAALAVVLAVLLLSVLLVVLLG